MSETVYLTGAAATGKSTLSRSLAKDEGFAVFEYGAEVLKYAMRTDPLVTHADTRASAGRYVTADHIDATDDALQRFVATHRGTRHAIIDSHAVTKEGYGFRAVPFTPDGLAKAALSRIVVLHCEPEVLLRRMMKDRDGRPGLSVWEAAKYIQLQETVAITYSTALGVPIHFINCDATPEVVRATFLDLIGSPSN